VTTIQKLLGHRRLNATMIYARVHDRTVEEDYYAAMAQIEKGLDLAAGMDATDNVGEPIDAGERARLLELASQLAVPQLGLDVRLDLVAQIRSVLHQETPEQTESPAGEEWERGHSLVCFDRSDSPTHRRAVVVEWHCRCGG
jgi:hypothetical protein